jgi:hypothetical protein
MNYYQSDYGGGNFQTQNSKHRIADISCSNTSDAIWDVRLCDSFSWGNDTDHGCDCISTNHRYLGSLIMGSI